MNIPRERALVPDPMLIWDNEEHVCGRCGKGTHYLDLGFEVPLCPHPCRREMWAEYWEASISVPYRAGKRLQL